MDGGDRPSPRPTKRAKAEKVGEDFIGPVPLPNEDVVEAFIGPPAPLPNEDVAEEFIGPPVPLPNEDVAEEFIGPPVPLPNEDVAEEFIGPPVPLPNEDVAEEFIGPPVPLPNEDVAEEFIWPVPLSDEDVAEEFIGPPVQAPVQFAVGPGDSELVLFQLPSTLFNSKPSTSERGKEKVEMLVPSDGKGAGSEKPDGYIGKLLVYRSGQLKLEMGDKKYDVSQSSWVTSLDVMAINIQDRTWFHVGEVRERGFVIPGSASGSISGIKMG